MQAATLNPQRGLKPGSRSTMSVNTRPQRIDVRIDCPTGYNRWTAFFLSFVKDSSQSNRAALFGCIGFLAGIAFWHFVGFWGFVSHVVFQGPERVTAPVAAPQQKTTAAPAATATKRQTSAAHGTDTLTDADKSAFTAKIAETLKMQDRKTAAPVAETENAPQAYNPAVSNIETGSIAISSECATLVLNRQSGQTISAPCSKTSATFGTNPTPNRADFASLSSVSLGLDASPERLQLTGEDWRSIQLSTSTLNPTGN